MHDLQEDFKDLSDRIGFKEHRRTAAQNIKEYKKCEDITEEISSLRRKRCEVESELTQLETKNRQSKWYYKKKKSASGQDTGKSRGPCHPAQVNQLALMPHQDVTYLIIRVIHVGRGTADPR